MAIPRTRWWERLDEHTAAHKARTASIVRTHKKATPGRTRRGKFLPRHNATKRKIPRPAPILGLEAELAREILDLLERGRQPLEQLIAELPELLAAQPSRFDSDSYFTSGQLTGPSELARRARRMFGMDEETGDPLELTGKRRVEVYGLKVWIENPVGSVRKWTDADGTSGETVMRNDYGYLEGVRAPDGDEVDVYLGGEPELGDVYVVHQMRAPRFKQYDEDKVMLGFRDETAARDAYLRHYDDPRFLGGVTTLTPDEFRSKLRDHKEDSSGAPARFDAREPARTQQLLARARKAMDDAFSVKRLEMIADEYARATTEMQRDSLRRQTKAALGVDVATLDRKVPRYVENFVANSVARIKSLGDRNLQDVERIVSRAFITGARAEEVAAAIKATYGATDKQARLIARDQLGTLHGMVNAARQRELGVSRFTWRTVGDERVRPEHEAVDGQVFSYDDLPPVGTYGERVVPGEAINCRCWAEPVFEDVLEEIAKPRVETAVPEPTSSSGELDDEEREDGVRLDHEHFLTQPRDEGGRFSSGGGGGGGGGSADTRGAGGTRGEADTEGDADTDTDDIPEGAQFLAVQRPGESDEDYAKRLKRNEASRKAKEAKRAKEREGKKPPEEPKQPPEEPKPPEPPRKVSPQKPGESDEEYAKRLKRNEASRKAKEAKRNAGKEKPEPPKPPPEKPEEPKPPEPKEDDGPIAPRKPGESDDDYKKRLARNKASRLAKAAKRAAKGGAQPKPPAPDQPKQPDAPKESAKHHEMGGLKIRADVPTAHGAVKPISKAEAKVFNKGLGRLADTAKARLNPKQQAIVRAEMHKLFDKHNLTDGRVDPLDGHGTKLEIKTIGRGSVAGYHTQFGSITLDRKWANKAGKLFERLSNGEDVAEKWRALKNDRGGYTPPGQRSAHEQRQDLEDEIWGLQLIVHEGLHGYGPRTQGGGSSAYEAHGLLVEEVTTEVAARKITRDTLGLKNGELQSLSSPENRWSRGSYNDFVSTARDAVQGVLERHGAAAGAHSFDKAYEHIEQASLRLKSATPVENTKEAVEEVVAKRRADYDKARSTFEKNAIAGGADPETAAKRAREYYSDGYIEMQIKAAREEHRYQRVDTADKLTKAFASSFDYDAVEKTIGRKLSDADREKIRDDIFEAVKKAGSGAKSRW